MATGAIETVWDVDAALERVDGDEEFLRELARLFVDRCGGPLGKIDEAIGRGDAVGVQKAAHELKGSALVFSATTVCEAALWLEGLGMAGRLDQASSARDVLAGAVALLRDRLEEFAAGVL